MKKTLLAVTLAALTSGAATSALAADPKAPEPDYALSANVGLFSDYRFRGITQNDKKPALQGGFDFAHKSGFYAGNWNSSISWVDTYDFGDSSGLESDFYFGFKTELGPIGIDLGNNYYYYAGTDINSNVPTNEVYLGLSYGPITFKTFYTTSAGYFSWKGRGTMYYSLSGSFPISESVTLKAAYGYTAGKKEVADLKGTDYSVGLAIDLGEGWSLGLAYVGAAGDYKTGFAGPDDGDAGAVVSISRSF